MTDTPNELEQISDANAEELAKLLWREGTYGKLWFGDSLITASALLATLLATNKRYAEALDRIGKMNSFDCFQCPKVAREALNPKGGSSDEATPRRKDV